MASELKAYVIASQYLDDGRYGVISDKNDIIVGINIGLTKEQCEIIAERINAWRHNDRPSE